MYPITLKLRGRRALVVGGGEVARRKVEALLEAGAHVKAVAPQFCDSLAEMAIDELIECRRRRYREDDLDGVWLVIGATDDPAANAQVAADAEARGLLVNIVDQPELCSFLVPATVRRGSLVIAVSTGGSSPALARRIRLTLEQQFGPEYGALADLLGELRPQVMARIPDQSQRQAVWEQILDSAALRLLAEGRPEEARQVVEGIVRRWTPE
jgi:precorrin-2 dehydrogenase/sirohydrochlorin ferrochelatase